jgi:magnesium chelatase family protein
MYPAEVLKFCEMDDTCCNLMKATSQQLQLTARLYQCIQKLASMIADLAMSESIQQQHLAEA